RWRARGSLFGLLPGTAGAPFLSEVLPSVMVLAVASALSGSVYWPTGKACAWLPIAYSVGLLALCGRLAARVSVASSLADRRLIRAALRAASSSLSLPLPRPTAVAARSTRLRCGCRAAGLTEGPDIDCLALPRALSEEEEGEEPEVLRLLAMVLSAVWKWSRTRANVVPG